MSHRSGPRSTGNGSNRLFVMTEVPGSEKGTLIEAIAKAGYATSLDAPHSPACGFAELDRPEPASQDQPRGPRPPEVAKRSMTAFLIRSLFAPLYRRRRFIVSDRHASHTRSLNDHLLRDIGLSQTHQD